MRNDLIAAAPAIGMIMTGVVLFLAIIAIAANEISKRCRQPDDEGGE